MKTSPFPKTGSKVNQNRKSYEKSDREVNVRTPNVTKEKVKEERNKGNITRKGKKKVRQKNGNRTLKKKRKLKT